jgi:hypothetical protein
MYQSRMPSGRVTRHSYKGRALSPIQRPGILVDAAKKIGTISRHRDWNAVFVGGVVEPGAMRVYPGVISQKLISWAFGGSKGISQQLSLSQTSQRFPRAKQPLIGSDLLLFPPMFRPQYNHIIALCHIQMRQSHLPMMVLLKFSSTTCGGREGRTEYGTLAAD